MNRPELESLVWAELGTDYRTVADGRRHVLHFMPDRGTCLVPMASLSLGELAEKLPESVRVSRALKVWRLIVDANGQRVLGVFGLGLDSEWREQARRIARVTGEFPKLVLFAGQRPRVGERFDASKEHL